MQINYFINFWMKICQLHFETTQSLIYIMFFQLEDIKRRHSPYFNVTNVGGWTTAVDSTPSWNYQRGLMIGAIACTFQQYLSHWLNHAKVLLKHYQPPTSARQAITFFKATKQLQSFQRGWKSKFQYGMAQTFLDIGLKCALFRQFNSGWQNNFGGFQWWFYRKIPTTLWAMVLASPFSVAIDMVNRAYQAEQTFPEDLKKGYKSYFDAFRRIPVEEGPYYLYKNTFPLFAKHILGPFTLFYTYDWLLDKTSWSHRIGDMPQLPVKMILAAFSTYLAAVFTYPFSNKVVQMVDLWPKKNGVDIWNGNYRKAASWLWFGPSFNIAFPGFFKNFFWHIAPMWFTTLLVADKLGMFSYWRVDYMGGAGDNNPQDSFI